MDKSITLISSPWSKRRNIDKEEKRENVAKHNTGKDDAQKRNVFAKLFESSETEVDDKNPKQSLPHMDNNEYRYHKGQLVCRKFNDTQWYYVN